MTTPVDQQADLYEPPELEVIGPVQQLTEVRYKTFGRSDGFTYEGAPITNASV